MVSCLFPIARSASLPSYFLSASVYRIVIAALCRVIVTSESVWQYKSCFTVHLIIQYLGQDSCIMFAVCWPFCFTGIHVQQMYPSNTTYGCPGKPSLVLNCTFPTDVAVVSWSCTGVAGIPDNYPGHQIDNNMFHSGISLLSVTDPSQLKQVYRCIIFHRDGTSEEMHRTVSIPAGKSPMQLPYSRLCKGLVHVVY